jgi:hypothetical protein
MWTCGQSRFRHPLSRDIPDLWLVQRPTGFLHRNPRLLHRPCAAGKLSEELKGKIFADAECARLWKFAEEQLGVGSAQDLGVTPLMMMESPDPDPDSGKNLLFGIAQAGALALVRDKENLAGAKRLVNDTEAIPRPEVLDRLLRAEAATERSLNRANDRLERLQRRRKGETVPPPLRASI